MLIVILALSGALDARSAPTQPTKFRNIEVSVAELCVRSLPNGAR